MDSLEAIMITKMMPVVKELMTTKNDKEAKEATRNLISKVGMRIGFGKEVFDKTIKS